MELDPQLDSKFFRTVDLIISDEAGANTRFENEVRQKHPDRASLHLYCDAHKKSKVATLGSDVQRPIDTKIIRFQLSMRGHHASLRAAMRDIIRERLVVINAANVDAEAEDYRRIAINSFMPTECASDVFRKNIVTRLFNGDWRRSDRVEHYCCGCCASREQTMLIMETVGVKALT
eukprot:2129947-Pyramimonas_sp.AAC.1